MRDKRFKQLRIIGLNIAYYRKFRGFSQSKLAEMVDISRTHMSRIETAQCEVSLHVLFDICEVLDIDIRDLFVCPSNFKML
ncbi:MAG: helix-turn-helix domain-containing protein [Acutalibacteraceae bacterium]